MNMRRFILIFVVLFLAATCCDGQTQRRTTPTIPDGEYRDAEGYYVLKVNGDFAVLVMKFPETTLTLKGSVAFGADGDFYLQHQSSNQYHLYFGRRSWRWKTDHFVVTELDPPKRTLKLERQ